MPLAISLPAGPLDLRATLDYAAEAESLGYPEAWIAEVAGPDAFTLAAAVAGRTGLRLGTAVVPVYNRTPMVMAMTAASLSQLTGGRFVLGFGTSSTNIVEKWNGIAFELPLTRMRETLLVLRDLLQGEKVSYEGRTIRLDGYRMGVRYEGEPKIYIGALNMKMLQLAGELADGVIINMLGPEHVPMVLAEVAAGAKAAGRDPTDIECVCRLQIVMDQPRETAAAVVRAAFGAYAATSVYNKFFRWIGFADEAAAVKRAWDAKDRAGVAAAISDPMVDALVVNGTAAECRARVQQYLDAGVDVPALSPLVLEPEAAWQTMRSLAPNAP
jgi:probable F420-dependent oxidoreductase